MSLMDRAVAVVEPNEGVETVYRADAERLWRAIYAFAGDAEIASDAVAEAFACDADQGGRAGSAGATVQRTVMETAKTTQRAPHVV